MRKDGAVGYGFLEVVSVRHETAAGAAHHADGATSIDYGDVSAAGTAQIDVAVLIRCGRDSGWMRHWSGKLNIVCIRVIQNTLNFIRNILIFSLLVSYMKGDSPPLPELKMRLIPRSISVMHATPTDSSPLFD